MKPEAIQQKLEEYYKIRNQIYYLQEEIKALYKSVPSPKLCGGECHRNGNRSPTENNAFRIIALKERVTALTDHKYELLEAIEEWLRGCTNYEVCAIVRWHYILGLNWRETNVKVFGVADYNYSKRKYMTYFKTQ